MRVRDKNKYKEITEFVDDYFLENARPPNLREIAEAVKMPTSTVRRYLVWMAEEGIVDYDGGQSRGVSTDTVKKARGGARSVPVVGSIACGTPALAEENIESYITVSTELTGRGEFYFLKASGDSMIKAGIDSGDLVLIKKQEEAYNGDIAVALVDGQETTLKRYYKDDGLRMIRLVAENDTVPDILTRDCRVQGIAIKVIKDLR